MDTSTNWFLNLIDRITEPMRSITAATNNTGDAVDDVQERVKLSEKSTKSALENEKKHRDSLKAKIKEQEQNLKELEAQQKKATGLEWQKVEHGIEKATESLKDYRHALQLADDDIKHLSDDLDEFKRKASNWDSVATGSNQLSEIIGNISESLDFSEEIMNVQGNIQLMTGVTGDELDELTTKVHRLAKQWNESDDEIARSANATAKQMGVSFQDALTLINDGFEKGANLNGDFLDQLKEYGPQLDDAGISASQAIAIMASAGKEGVFSDKAIDAIKEANLSLREMGQIQVDALAGIGLEVKDLAGKTTFEAVQMISKAMEGATAQARQMALTDIFKGAGEDAGMGFILSLGKTSMSLDDLPNVQATGADIKGFFADVQSSIATNVGGFALYAQGFADFAFQVNNVTGLVNTLRGSQTAMNVVTKIAEGFQWGLNFAMEMNPIGWVVLAVGALVGGIALLSDHFDWASGTMEAFSNSWKDWGTVILDLVLFPLKQVMGVLEGIWALMQGDFSGAMQAITAPTKELVDDTAHAVEKTQQGYKKGVDDFNKEAALEGKKDQNLSVDGHNKTQSTLDGQLAPTKGKKGSKTKGSDGLSISGGGGSKTTTMTLTVHNHFAAMNSKLDVRAAANEIAGILNDRLRDGLISQA